MSHILKAVGKIIRTLNSKSVSVKVSEDATSLILIFFIRECKRITWVQTKWNVKDEYIKVILVGEVVRIHKT